MSRRGISPSWFELLGKFACSPASVRPQRHKNPVLCLHMDKCDHHSLKSLARPSRRRPGTEGCLDGWGMEEAASHQRRPAASPASQMSNY